MRTACLFLLAILAMAGCSKDHEPAPDAQENSDGFITYTIAKDEHYCDKNFQKATNISQLNFTAKFDSSAIYEALLPENQYDIHKLYGFADNNTEHQQYSARFGWRWSDHALHLFAYIYNGGQRISEELGIVKIGEEIHCSILVRPNTYIFRLNEAIHELPRLATGPTAIGYQLYPYFGGDEAAPHTVKIRIREEFEQQ